MDALAGFVWGLQPPGPVNRLSRRLSQEIEHKQSSAVGTYIHKYNKAKVLKPKAGTDTVATDDRRVFKQATYKRLERSFCEALSELLQRHDDLTSPDVGTRKALAKDFLLLMANMPCKRRVSEGLIRPIAFPESVIFGVKGDTDEVRPLSLIFMGFLRAANQFFPELNQHVNIGDERACFKRAYLNLSQSVEKARDMHANNKSKQAPDSLGLQSGHGMEVGNLIGRFEGYSKLLNEPYVPPRAARAGEGTPGSNSDVLALVAAAAVAGVPRNEHLTVNTSTSSPAGQRGGPSGEGFRTPRSNNNSKKVEGSGRINTAGSFQPNTPAFPGTPAAPYPVTPVPTPPKRKSQQAASTGDSGDAPGSPLQTEQPSTGTTPVPTPPKRRSGSAVAASAGDSGDAPGSLLQPEKPSPEITPAPVPPKRISKQAASVGAAGPAGTKNRQLSGHQARMKALANELAQFKGFGLTGRHLDASASTTSGSEGNGGSTKETGGDSER